MTTKIVIIGGGTGTSTVLAGLRKYPLSLSALISTADDGSSSGILRRAFGMAPPGDLRQCLAALGDAGAEHLNYRFQKGPFRGHAIGNLLIASAYERYGSIQQAMDMLARIFNAKGVLIPMTLTPTTLIAHLSAGRTLRGESAITLARTISTSLKKLVLAPLHIRANPRAVAALREADAIIVGPGNLYASILPHFLVPEIRRAFTASRAKKIYVANLATQRGHTDDFSVSDFLDVLDRRLGHDAFTHVLYNTAPLPVSGRAGKVAAAPVRPPTQRRKDITYVGARLAAASLKVSGAADPIASRRNPFLHDAGRIAAAIIRCL